MLLQITHMSQPYYCCIFMFLYHKCALVVLYLSIVIQELKHRIKLHCLNITSATMPIYTELVYQLVKKLITAVCFFFSSYLQNKLLSL